MNKVITPIFLKASETSRDNFWKCFFQDLAFGIYSNGLFLSDENTLSCRVKGCEFDYKIPKTVHRIHKDLKNILYDRLKIESSLKMVSVDTKLEWVDIKKKSQKERLLEKYTIHLMDKHNLSINQTRTVQSFIMLAFQLKVIENTDVQLDTERYEIVSIDGVDIRHSQLVFTNPIKVEPIKQVKSVATLSMIELWDKFLKTM